MEYKVFLRSYAVGTTLFCYTRRGQLNMSRSCLLMRDRNPHSNKEVSTLLLTSSCVVSCACMLLFSLCACLCASVLVALLRTNLAGAPLEGVPQVPGNPSILGKAKQNAKVLRKPSLDFNNS